MNFRSDLALECREPLAREGRQGLRCSEEEHEGYRVTRLEVLDGAGAEAIGKPPGRYITIELPPLGEYADIYGPGMECAAGELQRLLPPGGPVLVAGLGNGSMTPDALGPRCCALVLATRHIAGELAKSAGLGSLRPVMCLTPGVLGRTGMESAELVAAAVRATKPAAVLTVDALAARKLSRLGCTIQLSDSGIVPGSGVGNARRELSRGTLGVPVVSLGVPTVVDAATLVADLAEASAPPAESAGMMVTPREVDLLVERAAKLCAMAVNRALQPHLAVEDFLELVE
ncbi:MAG: GPR endopeptidase [Oscillospiraceae bacterium]|jgi:spore protease|nr:GPR endopeptidase [Oscillospiraceae bacterium]